MKKLGICLMVLMMVSVTQAAAITIANPSFETVVTSPWNPGWVESNPVGWSSANPYYVAAPRTFYSNEWQGLLGATSAQNGTNVCLATGTNVLLQTLSATWQANTTYTLSAYMTMGQSGYSTGEIGLAYGAPAATGTFTMALSNVAASSGGVVAGASWALITATFTTGSADSFLGAPITIFARNTVVDGGNNLQFDNFSLTAIPEPATVALLGLGLALTKLTRSKK